MSFDAELEVVYNIANAPIRDFPYPHIFVRDVFPRNFYERILEQLPPEAHLRTLRSLKRVSDNYPDTRLVMPLTPEHVSGLDDERRPFWEGMAGWLLGGPFGQLMTAKFQPYLQGRFGNLAEQRFFDEALIVRDYTKYSLGPHTDSPQKVLSFLFYLPPDDSRAHLGTSIYLPKDRAFVCPGGPHHRFDRFDRMLTMPYVRNALFAFMKTPNSFHGVEPIQEEGVRRDLLLYDIKVSAAAPAVPPLGGAPVKFTM